MLFFLLFFAFHLDLCCNIRMINIIFGIFFTSTNIWPLWISSSIQITDREADEITSIFLLFFIKRKQKDLSAVFVFFSFQNQPQISWQTFLRGRGPATGNRTFFPTLNHTPCSTVTSLAAETAMHFFLQMTFMRACLKGTNEPLSLEDSSGQMIVLCVTVTSIHIHKHRGPCRFAVSVTWWYRKYSQLMMGPKSLLLHPFPWGPFSRYQHALQKYRSFEIHSSQCWVLKSWFP